MERKTEKIYDEDGNFDGFAKRTPTVNSRRKRLKFIRHKNKIRNGQVMKLMFKISDEMMPDTGFIKKEAEHSFFNYVSMLKKVMKIKFSFPGYHIELGRQGRDFEIKLVTAIISFDRFGKCMTPKQRVTPTPRITPSCK